MKSILVNKQSIEQLPGTPVNTGDGTPLTEGISVLTYNHSFAEMRSLSSVDELPAYNNDSAVFWVNINGINDIDSIKRLEKMYDIHPLTIEDVLDTKQQPKIETFENYRFMSLKSITQGKHYNLVKQNNEGYNTAEQARTNARVNKKKLKKFNSQKTKEQSEDVEEFVVEHISIIIMKNVLITIQEIPGDSFGDIRKRILGNIGRIRKMGTDYLAYSLIDTVVDEYFITLEHFEDDIEDLEDRATKTDNDTFISEIQDTKKYIFQIKRAMLPLRENLMIISRQDMLSVNEELKPFLQDLRENLSNAIVSVETYREWLTNIMDVNLSVLSYQLNKVMKILAVISAIFIPLTFIAGIYGMNFEFMPELAQPWGYPIVLGLMGTVALSMVILFKTRKWF
jgi:magnesium transporter